MPCKMIFTYWTFFTFIASKILTLNVTAIKTKKSTHCLFFRIFILFNMLSASCLLEFLQIRVHLISSVYIPFYFLFLYISGSGCLFFLFYFFFVSCLSCVPLSIFLLIVIFLPLSTPKSSSCVAHFSPDCSYLFTFRLFPLFHSQYFSSWIITEIFHLFASCPFFLTPHLVLIKTFKTHHAALQNITPSLLF